MSNKLIYILAAITIVTWTLEAFVGIPDIFPLIGALCVIAILTSTIYKQLNN